MSGLFGSVTIPGNRLTDIAQQTSAVGMPIPFGYGRFLVDGNIIWTAGRPTEHVTKKKQGKGGVKTQEYTYTLSYAIAFCAGPIFGYFTILRDGKVVYTTDPNATIEDKDFAAKWAQKCTMYFGTRTQLPDSTIEAKQGAGKVSAFRDLAYIVVEDDDVTGNGGAVPQYQAVVIASPPEVYMTSRPYAAEILDSVQGSVSAQRVRLWPQPYPGDQLATTMEPLDITRYGGTQAFTVPTEALATAVEPLEITRYGGSADLGAPGDSLTTGAEPVEITRYGGAVTYPVPAESLSTAIEPLNITRSTP